MAKVATITKAFLLCSSSGVPLVVLKIRSTTNGAICALLPYPLFQSSVTMATLKAAPLLVILKAILMVNHLQQVVLLMALVLNKLQAMLLLIYKFQAMLIKAKAVLKHFQAMLLLHITLWIPLALLLNKHFTQAEFPESLKSSLI